MRYALGLEYDGSRFYGFQRQRQSPTVQECLEEALSRVADEAVGVLCSGRTDTGVHAFCQVVHFDTRAERSERAWVLGCNSALPDDVSVLWVRHVPAEFHARFSARGRSYRYRILNRWVRPGLMNRYLAWVRKPLDAGRMHEAARVLVGEHDFSAFRAVGCQAKSPVKIMRSISVRREGQEVILETAASAYLYHMVRNIAGTLIRVGTGEADVEWVSEVLANGDRREAGITAPAGGLYFLKPEYPEEFNLPLDEAPSKEGGCNIHSH